MNMHSHPYMHIVPDMNKMMPEKGKYTYKILAQQQFQHAFRDPLALDFRLLLILHVIFCLFIHVIF